VVQRAPRADDFFFLLAMSVPFSERAAWAAS
jgi:hypothetical protein